MKKYNFVNLYRLARDCFLAVAVIIVTTFFLFLANRRMVGEGVIVLVFLMPVAWSAYHWGLGGGISAAISAALMFDFFFIPPYYTFTIGSPEGILIMVIFLTVAILVVDRIQTTLSKARISEQEAVTMYEFSTMLAGQRSQQAIALNVARFIRQRYMAEQVLVWVQFKDQPAKTTAQESQDKIPAHKPDCILPILTSWGLVGEVQIWRGAGMLLPHPESRLFRNLALQIGMAIERVQITEYEFEHLFAHKSAQS